MNAIVVDEITMRRPEIEKALEAVSDHLGDTIQAVGLLLQKGAAAAGKAGISLGLIGSVFDYAGRMQADLGHAALMLQGVHASLHEALKRLQPSDPTPQVSGGKVPPPPP